VVPEVVGSNPIGRPISSSFPQVRALALRRTECQSPAQMNDPASIAREALNQWNFVIAAYVVGVGATVALVVWSWLAMRRAERRRDRSREQ
jgi:hypothetical protein